MNALQQQELEEVEYELGQNRLEGMGFKNEKYKVTDIEGVNWAFRKLNVLKKKEDEIDSLVQSELARLDRWRSKERESIIESRQYFEGLISEYLMEQKKLDPKAKISTPYGKANTRKQQPKFTYDDAKVIESLKNLGHMEYIKTVWEVKKAELKKDITIVGQVATDINGEVIDGIAVEPQEDKVSISLEG